MDLRYTKEKLEAAVRGMAMSAASLQQRISNTYIDCFCPLTEDDLPSDLKALFAEIVTSLPSTPTMTDAEAEAEAEAEGMAQKILRLYDEVRVREA